MADSTPPIVGEWYAGPDGQALEIVAVDDEAETVEVQYFDGTIEEYDFESWFSLEFQPADAPEDWSGSYDLEREDYGVDLDVPGHADVNNPLDELDNQG